MHTKQLSTILGCHCGSGNCLEGFYILFPPFNPSLNFLKFHLNSCLRSRENFPTLIFS